MNLETRIFSRQEFNKLAGGALAAFLLSPDDPPDPTLPDQQIQTIIPSKPFASIFGIHDTARLEGSLYLDNMAIELKPLKPKIILGLNPRPVWYDVVKEIGAVPIVRLALPQNADNQEEAKKQISQVPKDQKIVARNEMNLHGETGDIPTFPETAAEYDAKTIRLIVDHGCIPLLTPTSPEGWLQNMKNQNLTDKFGNPFHETHYYETYMQRLEELGVFRDFPQIEIALHAYDFSFHAPAAENMWERISRFNRDIILRYAGKRPIHVTEGGVFLADVPEQKIDYGVVGKAISELMASNVPVDLADQLQSFAYWIYAVDTQTTAAERLKQDSRFEKTALVQLVKKSDGLFYSVPNLMYQAIYQYQQTH